MEVRAAEPADVMARVHVRSWQVAYRYLMPKDYLDQLRPEDRASKYDFGNLDPLRPHTIVATESGRIRGFATTAPTRDPKLPDYGELLAFYVDPDPWGRGIGVTLISAARVRLFAQGFQRAVLWVLAGNTRAEDFYREDQWAPDGASRTDEVWGLQVTEIRYRRQLAENTVRIDRNSKA